MRHFFARTAHSFLSRRQCALLAAALLALPAGALPLRAQVDLATVRARAEQGDAEALNVLGNAFSQGQGVPQDLTEAVRLYALAAERGHAPAHFNLGMAYELGRGVAADLAVAFSHYRKAAEAGFAPAQFNVGNMYGNGIGVRQDFFEAALWFRHGAEAGVPEAQYNLALAYELGRGVTQDEAAAQKWYRAAADRDYARARYNLALMIEEGRGSAADPATAADLYRAAALQNFAPAQNNLGILLAEGRGVPPNLTEAYAWFSVATENGAKPTGRDALAEQFTSTQLAEANVAVAKLRAHLARPKLSAPAAVQGAPAPAPAPTPTPVAQPQPAAVAVADEPDTKALLAAAQADLAELLVEHTRVRGLLQTISKEKGAIEKRLAELPSVPGASGDRAKLDTLADALDEARAENARLAGAVETAQRERATFDERLAASAQLLQREREALQGRVATAEAAAVKARSSAAPTASTEPEFANVRAQIAQLTRDNETLRHEHQQARQQLADVTAQLAAAGAPAAASLATVANEVPPIAPAPAGTSAEANRIAKLLADNARLNDEVRRATIRLSTMNRQLRTAHESLAKAGLAAPLIASNPQEQATLAELTREIAELRASQRALADENRRLLGVQTTVAKPVEGALGGGSPGDRQEGR